MRDAGIPVEALTEYISLFQQGSSTDGARKQILIDQRKLLLERMEHMKKTLKLLNTKIERYEQLIIPAEGGLI